MRYQSFRIQNFRGVKDTLVDLSSLTGANVFSLVGLNESGKTTLLEAIHSFSPDYRSSAIVKVAAGTGKERAEKRVPRHQIASFTGEIVVEAKLFVDDIDRTRIASYLLTNYELVIDPAVIPNVISMAKVDVFKRGDYVRSENRLGFVPEVKNKNQRKPRTITSKELDSLWFSIWIRTPDIAYYPTFIFDFPERIYLTDRHGSFSSFYASVFEDILAVDGQGYTLKDITRRVRSDKFKSPWLEFFPNWMTGDDRGKVQQIIDRASSAVTRTVFGKWNTIFGEEVGGKELVIEYNVEEGRTFDKQAKTYTANQEHDVYIWFEIKDGTRRFKVNDRSLGFRWFFAFLLFTQFRVNRKVSRNVLFLFDEPASNLHAAAQQKLIESFPEIASDDNMLLYTTHSHYMIDPAWLEQTFIITNRSEAPNRSMVDSATLDDESLDVQAHRYRNFVNSHPNDTSYFQPIVDRLNVVPSKFDYNLPSVVVEGKSDYYILEYARRLLKLPELRLLPAVGSGTFDALIALGAGWGVKFLFMLDADDAGVKERKRYALEMGAREEALTYISDYISTAKEIESLIDAQANSIIKSSLNITGKLSKKQILRFFQENLAKDSLVSLGSNFEKDARTLLTGLTSKLDSL